jgi:Tfp pilus assembly protein PilV
MKGISTIIVMILILLISISLTGLGYVTFTTFFSQITASSQGAISQTLTTMLAQMKIESITNDTVRTTIYIRNTGKVDLTNFTAYVNDANYQPQPGTPSGNKIAPGGVDYVNITGIFGSGSVIKITTAQGAVAMQAK